MLRIGPFSCLTGKSLSQGRFGKHVDNFVIARNEFRGSAGDERTENHNTVAWV